MAFPSEHRLANGSLISTVCKKGASLRTPFFRIGFLPAKRKKTQVACIVSKKFDKRAVVRNKVRRRLISHLQDAFSHLPLKNPLLITLFPTKGALTASSEEITKSITKLIPQLEKWDFTRKKKFIPRKKKS